MTTESPALPALPGPGHGPRIIKTKTARDYKERVGKLLTGMAPLEGPVEVVASIAYRESRFDPRVVNAVTGCWGPMQVNTRRRGDEWAGYRAGVAKLREARRYCARRGEGELCVLAAYASGPAGVRGRWYRGPRRVQREAARLRAAMGLRVMAPVRAGKAQS